MPERLDESTPKGDQEPVVFCNVGNNRYSMQIKAERPYFDNDGIARIIPAKVIRFENCTYVTSDPEEIRLIRESDAYKRGEVFEPSKDARPSKPQQASRGVIDTDRFKEEAGGKTVRPEGAITLKESSHVCDVAGCEASFNNAKSLHMHKMGKHRKRKKAGRGK